MTDGYCSMDLSLNVRLCGRWYVAWDNNGRRMQLLLLDGGGGGLVLLLHWRQLVPVDDSSVQVFW